MSIRSSWLIAMFYVFTDLVFFLFCQLVEVLKCLELCICLFILLGYLYFMYFKMLILGMNCFWLLGLPLSLVIFLILIQPLPTYWLAFPLYMIFPPFYFWLRKYLHLYISSWFLVNSMYFILAFPLHLTIYIFLECLDNWLM